MVLLIGVPTSFAGVDSFVKMKRLFLDISELVVSAVLTFDLIPQHDTGIMVLSTVAPISFAGVDCFDKMRFWFITGHLPIL